MTLLLFLLFGFILFYVIGSAANEYKTDKEKKHTESSIKNSCNDFSKNGFASNISDRISILCKDKITKFLNPNNKFLARFNYDPEMATSYLLTYIKISVSCYGFQVNLQEDESYVSFYTAQIRSTYLSENDVQALKKAICKISNKWELHNNEICLSKNYWETYIRREALKLKERYLKSIYY